MTTGKKTGATAIFRNHVLRHSMETFTKADLLSVLNKNNLRTKWAGNVIVGLVKHKFCEATDEYKGRFKVYKVTAHDLPRHQPKVEARKEDLDLAELENQLLAEMEKTEELSNRIKELEGGFELDELRLGKSVFRAYTDLQTRLNQSEASSREEIAKMNKIHSDDRQMIGSLQKKVKALEAENRAIRSRLQNGISSSKTIDAGIFNPPRISGGK